MNEALPKGEGVTEEAIGQTNRELMAQIIRDKKEQIEAADRVLELLKDGLESLGTKPTKEEAEAISATANYYSRVKLEAEEYLGTAEQNKDEIGQKEKVA